MGKQKTKRTYSGKHKCLFCSKPAKKYTCGRKECLRKYSAKTNLATYHRLKAEDKTYLNRKLGVRRSLSPEASEVKILYPIQAQRLPVGGKFEDFCNKILKGR